MLDHQDEINHALKTLQFIGFSRMPKSHGDVVVENSLSLYTTLEMLTVLFGFVIFMGAITGVACVCTGRKRCVFAENAAENCQLFPRVQGGISRFVIGRFRWTSDSATRRALFHRQLSTFYIHD